MRRFRYKSAEYDQVLAWIKKQPAVADEKEDEKSPEPLGYSMPADYLPRIAWAH